MVIGRSRARRFLAPSAYLMAFCLFVAPSGVMADSKANGLAVIIGNSDYRGGRVPPVEYARHDADAFDRYVNDILGYRDGNIIDLRDATQAEMEAVLGNARTIQGRLWQMIKPGVSEVVVYFSGHGAPGQQDHKGYLLPIDADPEKPEISGFPIDVLVDNLAKLEARSTIVYIDACFSGDTPKGSLIHFASPLHIVSKEPAIPSGFVVLTAGQSDQIASWDSRSHHGLFTVHLLDALYGKGDQPPYGNGDGKVSASEVKAYLDDFMTYSARREFGRTQNASLRGESDLVVTVLPHGQPILRPDVPDRHYAASTPPASVTLPPKGGQGSDALFWASIRDSKKIADFDAYVRRFPNGTFVELARSRLVDLRAAADAAARKTGLPGGETVLLEPGQATRPLSTVMPTVAVPPSPGASNQFYFASEQSAKTSCPGDVVVWVNTDTGVYHYPGRRWYGRTKDGGFMCEKMHEKAGVRPAANRQ